ncbi:MAG: tetratricopeptide repeat protein [Candidatus Lokiarchaeota archaeon]|nr:tetratricopeptide repeat protein [Candidatus Lokiarchaeota archaeon]
MMASNNELNKQAKKYLIESNYNEAIRLYRQILKDNPEDLETKSNLGYALTQNLQFEDAKKIFEGLIGKSDQELYLLNYGVVLSLLHEYKEAIKIFRSILDKNPSNIDAWKNLSEIYLRTENHKEANICRLKLNKIKEGM